VKENAMTLLKTITAIATAALIGWSGSAAAQANPDQPIKIVVPFAPGGSPDIVARLLAPLMSQSLGRQVFVENRAGAGGTVAAKGVADAEPNGATLLMTTVSTQAIAPALFPNLPYDPTKHFAPISLVANVPLILVVTPSLPAKNLQELIALLRANPGKYDFASSGVGAPLHLAGELFKSMTGTQITHVPYRGSGPALTDLIAGRVAMFFGDAPSTLPQVEAKTVRPLGVGIRTRLGVVPEVPTMTEAGLPGFEAYTWNALFAPAGTPKPVVERLNAAVTQALNAPDVRERLRTLGYEVVGSTPEALDAHVRAEIAKWGEVIKTAGVKAEQ
jgi:tripartite-type tricarboxylate transporter receptor subunit TctC